MTSKTVRQNKVLSLHPVRQSNGVYTSNIYIPFLVDEIRILNASVELTVLNDTEPNYAKDMYLYSDLTEPQGNFISRINGARRMVQQVISDGALAFFIMQYESHPSQVVRYIYEGSNRKTINGTFTFQLRYRDNQFAAYDDLDLSIVFEFLQYESSSNF